MYSIFRTVSAEFMELIFKNANNKHVRLILRLKLEFRIFFLYFRVTKRSFSSPIFETGSKKLN